MSVVIRDALIRLRIELEKSKLDSPEASGVKKAFDEQAKAARETAKVTRDASAANRAYAESAKEYIGGTSIHWSSAESAVRKSNQQILSHMTEGLEGITRFTRGVALMGVNTEQEMHALLQRLIKLQAGFDIVAGGAKYIKGLGLAFGSTGMAVGGVTLALAAGAIGWQMYQQKIESAKKALEEARIASMKFTDQQRADERRQSDREFARIDRRRKVLFDSTGIDAREREELEIQKAANEKGYQRKAPTFAGDYYGHAFRDAERRRQGGDLNKQDEVDLRAARGFEQQRMNLAQKQWEMDRKTFEQQQGRMAIEETFRQNAFGAFGVMGGASAFGAVTALQAESSSNYKTKFQEVVKAQDEFLETLLGAYQKAEQRVIDITNALGEANPK